ncbi:MAG: hypothetical protein QM703_20195 [Gemmatales bacterium]
MTDANYGLLDRIFNGKSAQPLSKDTSTYLLSLEFPKQDIDRTNELLAKNRQDALTFDEKNELSHLIDVNYFLAALKSKARLALKQGH